MARPSFVTCTECHTTSRANKMLPTGICKDKGNCQKRAEKQFKEGFAASYEQEAEYWAENFQPPRRK